MKRSKLHLATVALSLVAMELSPSPSFKIEGGEPFQTNLTPLPATQYKNFVSLILDRVRTSVLASSDITQKEEVLTLIDSLERGSVVAETGSDALRAKYVHLQGSIEHILAGAMVLGEIHSLVGVIHTPTPATPLCTKVDNLDAELLDESIRHDLDKLLTVRSRAVIIREYLENRGRLFVVYPKGGLEKRTAEQQVIYKQELDRYVGHLFDGVLSCSTMDPEMIGATYFFRNKHDEIFSFSIKAKQANAPTDHSEWAIWIGKASDDVVKERINSILDYLKAHGGPDLQSELARN